MSAFVALCLSEHYHDDTDSAWSIHCSNWRSHYGSVEWRERVALVAEGIEKSWDLAYEKEPDLGYKLIDVVGCWDFDVIPLLADYFAKETMDVDNVLDFDVEKLARNAANIMLMRIESDHRV